MTLLRVAFRSFANVPTIIDEVRDKTATGEVFRSGCAHIVGRRRSQINDTTN